MSPIEKIEENLAHLKRHPSDVQHQLRHCEAMMKAIMEHIRTLIRPS